MVRILQFEAIERCGTTQSKEFAIVRCCWITLCWFFADFILYYIILYIYTENIEGAFHWFRLNYPIIYWNYMNAGGMRMTSGWFLGNCGNQPKNWPWSIASWQMFYLEKVPSRTQLLTFSGWWNNQYIQFIQIIQITHIDPSILKHR